MKAHESGSLSRLAQELLAAERGVVEPSPLKERALSRARRVHDSDRASGIGSKALLRARSIATHGRSAIAIAATLAVAGLAAAAIALSEAPDLAVPAGSLHRALRPVSRQPRQLVPAASAESVAMPLAPAASPGNRRNAPRPSSARQYALEVELLEPARLGVARSDYGRALEAIARHRQEFPSGQLAEERAALQVRALRGLGRTVEAEAAATAFRQRYPKSALLGSTARSRTP